MIYNPVTPNPEQCDEDVMCSTGPSKVFPLVVPCKRAATEFLFGDPYCRTCADKLIKIHYAFAVGKVAYNNATEQHHEE